MAYHHPQPNTLRRTHLAQFQDMGREPLPLPTAPQDWLPTHTLPSLSCMHLPTHRYAITGTDGLPWTATCVLCLSNWLWHAGLEGHACPLNYPAAALFKGFPSLHLGPTTTTWNRNWTGWLWTPTTWTCCTRPLIPLGDREENWGRAGQGGRWMEVEKEGGGWEGLGGQVGRSLLETASSSGQTDIGSWTPIPQTDSFPTLNPATYMRHYPYSPMPCPLPSPP